MTLVWMAHVRTCQHCLFLAKKLITCIAVLHSATGPSTFMSLLCSAPRVRPARMVLYWPPLLRPILMCNMSGSELRCMSSGRYRNLWVARCLHEQKIRNNVHSFCFCFSSLGTNRICMTFWHLLLRMELMQRQHRGLLPLRIFWQQRDLARKTSMSGPFPLRRSTGPTVACLQQIHAFVHCRYVCFAYQ